jgi:myo-inositol-1(or 4)-monophosphatase
MPCARPDPSDCELPAALRLVAEQAARAGGQVARSCFGRVSSARLKGDHSEVSEADDAAQAAIVASILAQRPVDAFLAEEVLGLPDGPRSWPRVTNDRVCWVIDPIDGTRNFLRGIPLWACSVAAMRGGLPLCGAVYDPLHDVLYSAGGGVGGLLLDGQPSAPAHSGAARPTGLNPKPVVGIPSSPTGPTAAIAYQWLERFVCRSLGSTALQLAWVASGQLDATLSDNARLWDIAAAWVLVTASGGRITSPEGAPLFPLDVQRYAGEKLPTLAARAALYDQLLPG